MHANQNAQAHGAASGDSAKPLYSRKVSPKGLLPHGENS